MAKSRAGRRMQRHEKRQVAKATRDTKYEKQKGGIGKPQHRKKIIHSGAVTEDDNRPMAVIRDGKAVYLGAFATAEEAALAAARAGGPSKSRRARAEAGPSAAAPAAAPAEAMVEVQATAVEPQADDPV